MNPLDLDALIKRLEAATGPDREIDAAIFNAFPNDRHESAYRENDCNKLRSFGRSAQFHDGWLIRRTDRANDRFPSDLSRVTASLDAAIAFCERILPGYGITIQITARGAISCGVGRSEDTLAYAVGMSPALALCLAAVRAYAEEKNDDVE